MSINLQNLQPNWRYLKLGHIRQVRQTLRTGRYTIDCRRIIKDAQRELAAIRAAKRAPRTVSCGCCAGIGADPNRDRCR